MHKIDKFLAKLDTERQERVLDVLLQIQSGNFENLDIKKLKDKISRYRVRVGQCRIIFETVHSSISIIEIEFKSSNTYKR